MAQTILVTTDLSLNSKAALRFAIQLEKQGKYNLVFYHSVPFLKPTRWSEVRYESYVKEQMKETWRQLFSFVSSVYQSAGIRKADFHTVVEQSSDPVGAIVAYAKAIGASAICMSTRGAGGLKKLIGTHASGVIQASHVPVFVIPKTYRRSPISNILYASDFNEISNELRKVRSFSRKLKAKVSVYHYDYLAQVAETREALEKKVRKIKTPDVSFKFQKYNIDKSLADHLLKDMRTAKASLTVLFTNQKRGWFDKLFLSSKSVDVAYDSKLPLLIFQKE